MDDKTRGIMNLLDERELTPDAARYLLSMKLPSRVEDRVNDLSAKARAGSLSEAETQELDSYLHIGFLLGVLQAKACVEQNADYPVNDEHV